MDPITALIVNLVVLIVTTGAQMLIAHMRGQDKKQVPGVRGTRQVGGTNPLAFIVGTYGTAGQFEYGGDWGNNGETPNAYRSEVYSYSDLAIDGMSGRFIAGERVTLGATPHPELGYPALEYRVDGKDHLWFRDYTGAQTTADPLLRAKFGNDPDRPWTADMVFRGVAYSIVTSLWNRELFAGAIPEPMFELRGIRAYDVRKDGSKGGVGEQLLSNPATWTWTDNPIVIIYNILLGLEYEGQWFWGGQDIEQHHLPYANWVAQMDKCDVLVTRNGVSEKRFRCGLEISVDSEPQAIIGELLKACEGRISENGGIYKVLVGEPDAPVVSVTAEDIVVSAQQTFDPFPGLENLFNEMRADYPEPAEAWEMKEAPPRLRSDLVAKDDGRTLPFSTSYKAVPFAGQVQELMYAAIEEARRFSKLVKTHPPEFWEYEPLDTYLLTDPADGFVNKQFIITAMDDLPNGNQVVGAQEIYPADYTPPPGYELPYDVAPLTMARPAPQQVSGPGVASVAGEIAYDVFWSAPSVAVDVQFVRVSHREPGAAAPRWSGLIPKPDLMLGEGRVYEGLYPGEAVEVQIEYVPVSGRATVASAWMPVTIADVRVGPDDLTDELKELIEETFPADIQGLRDDVQEVRDTADAERDARLLDTTVLAGEDRDLRSAVTRAMAQVGEISLIHEERRQKSMAKANRGKWQSRMDASCHKRHNVDFLARSI